MQGASTLSGIGGMVSPSVTVNKVQNGFIVYTSKGQFVATTLVEAERLMEDAFDPHMTV